MLTYPDIDPVALHLGPLKIHWYGLMYLIGFAAAWWLGTIRAKAPHTPLKPEQVSDLIFYCAMGLIIGARLGYILFYNFSAYVENPMAILRVWEGGMSFHGGLIGVIIAIWMFSRKINQTFFRITDFIVPLTAIGICAGRIGNFINGELWGRVTDVPWAMVFPNGGDLPRHPSQLYEAFLEGIVLFIILWIYTSKPRPTMAASGLFLLCYGIFRFSVEFVRNPDGYVGIPGLQWLTIGQGLSAPMIFAGAILMVLAYKRAGSVATQK